LSIRQAHLGIEDFMRSSELHAGDLPIAGWLILLFLAVAVHVFGLGGQYIPSNGDEMVYAHIARETAETGQWLPLASELPDTRNTKPPLLFWQAMVAGDWGQHWSMAVLRAPSLIYTLLVAAAIAACVRLVTRRWPDALLAACLYLAFFSTFRYGRPYLTSAPETFWFSLPLFGLLWQRLRMPGSGPGWGLHILFGLGLGLGLAYKSFALIAPAAAAWWLALVMSEPHITWRVLLRHTVRTAFSATLGLGVFALWFVLDPDPAAVWREFIVGENAAKFSDARGYWQEALSLSGSSIWSQLLAYAVNAGLLFFVVLGLGWLGLKKLAQLRPGKAAWPLPPHLAILLGWSLVWLLVFIFPSQRSARYVIPAMPAVAMLLALYWRDMGSLWFVPTLLLSALDLLVLGRIAWVGHSLALSTIGEMALTLLVLAAGALVIAAGLWRASWTRLCALLACLLVYAGFGLTVAPLDGPLGRYAPQAAQDLPVGRVAVPNNFNGQYERYRFLLPGPHRFVPYDTDARALARVQPGSTLPTPAAQLDKLLAGHAAVVWGQSTLEEVAPPCLPGCSVLGERWQLRSRYLSGEITLTNLWYPQQWLFRREWLLARATPH
jgi:4-amino-4-deoxy-L-arabinose transferase-like glycosyltransferase